MSLLLSDTPGENDGGYFRIGDVILRIPPESISTNKVTDNEEVSTLRAKYPMYVKDGHSRWDVTVTWKALVTNDGGTPDYTQWVSLQRILAMFKAAPFVQVESGHLRQLVMADPELDRADRTARMAFALRQLRVDTLPDIPQGLQCTLTMSWFNYLPYSTDFGYLDPNGQPEDATQYTQFTDYIDTWLSENLQGPPDPFDGRPDLSKKFGYPDLSLWNQQTPGTVKLHWRQYCVVPIDDQTAPSASAPAAPSQPTGIPSSKLSSGPADIRAKITQAAQAQGVDPALALAVAYHESRFNPTAKNPNSSAYGVFQIIPRWHPEINQYPNKGVQDVDSNIQVGVGYLKQCLNHYNGNQKEALWAYNQGEGAVDNFLRGKTSALPNGTVQYADAVLQMAYQGTPQVKSTPVADASPLKSAAPVQAAAPSTDTWPEPVETKVNNLIAKGWWADHNTERAVFLYKPHQIEFQDEEHGGGPNLDCCYPVQISVVFVNKIAVQPLRGYQYPVMQHLGPAGTMISVGFLSNALPAGDSEPVHSGPAKMAGMCSALEDQFHRLQGEWRSIYAIHRMQAVIVENQVLNALGIYGTLVNNFNSETLPESASLAQAALSLVQYENVFEEIGSYRVNGLTGASAAVLNQIMTDGTLATASKGPGGDAYKPLTQYQSDKQSQNPAPVMQMMQDSRYQTPVVPMPVKLTADQQQTLVQAIASNKTQASASTAADSTLVAQNMAGVPTFNASGTSLTGGGITQVDPELASRIQSGSFSYNDYFQFVHSPGLSGNASIQSLNQSVNQVIANQVPADQAPMTKLYQSVFDYQSKYNAAFVAAVGQMQFDPTTASKFTNAVNPNGPGSDDANKNHGSYRDLGLKTLSLGNGLDFNPGYYFTNNEKKQRQALRDQLTYAVSASNAALSYFNKATSNASSAPADNSIQNSDSQNPAAMNVNTEMILERTVTPFKSMKRAFPTFKLFLVEEDNTGPFFMFDNFYCYSSVLNMEIIRYQDKPDMAVIQLTNLANLLSHKVFDSSASGKQEYNLSNLQDVPGSSVGGPVTGGMGGAVQARKTPAGVVLEQEKILNLSKGYNAQVKDVPLQYYPLQTGAKIQIRMGYTNNPDLLYPVFTGKVTQIEGEDILTITAQSFMLELMDKDHNELRSDGYFNLSTVSETIRNWGVPTKGAAYGGWTFLRDSGTAGCVMSDVLKCSGARHFGHWQVNPVQKNTPFMRGFGWIELTAAAAGALGASKIQSVTQALQDRRDENILINQLISTDGTVAQQRIKRADQFEKPAEIFASVYGIPDDPEITPWTILRDISRRYPEYRLLERPYGFPYGCDGTLVFAHPNDLYITRPKMANSAEATAMNITNNGKFEDWFTPVQRAKIVALPGMSDLAADAARYILMNVTNPSGSKAPATSNRYTSAERLGEQTASWIDQGGLTTFNAILNGYADYAAQKTALSKVVQIFEFGLGDLQGHANDLRMTVRAIQNDAISHINLPADRQNSTASDPSSPAYLQPVRKWHVISTDNIIHNGITINEQIFNAVRINKDIIKANINIPDYYTRVLDCNKLIIEPDRNLGVAGGPGTLERAYAQSFLREEVGKMYRGELVITGVPEMDPGDGIMLLDSTTGTAGPLEIESVIHSFDQEMGYITVVRPRAMVVTNEATTLGIIAAFNNLNLFQELGALGRDLSSTPQAAAATAVGATAAVTTAGLAVSTAVAAGVSLTGVGLAVVVGMLLTYVVLADMKQESLPLIVAPLNRYGRPWVGGLNGWALTDLHTYVEKRFQQFWNFEIAPTLQGFKNLKGIVDSYT